MEPLECHIGVGLRAPVRLQATTPAAKGARRQAIGVQHVPARIITGFVVGAESVNGAVGVNVVG